MNERTKKLKNLGLFSAKDVVPLGIDRVTLSRWTEAGKIERVGRGLYWHPDGKIEADELDFAVGCRICGPQSFVGGMTALFHYNLLNSPPVKIWMIAPHGKVTANKKYHVIQSNGNLSAGVIKEKFYRVSSLERTLVEVLRYTNKVGLDTALTASISAIQSNQTSPEKILRLAKKIGLASAVMKHWEVLISAQEVAQNG